MVRRIAWLALLAPVVAFAAAPGFRTPLPKHFTFSAPQSTLEFTATENNVAVHGHFMRFSGEARLDPAKPGDCSATATIDLASVASDSENAADNLKTADWFDIAHFPQATFEAHGCKYFGSDKLDVYETTGTLTLKGVKQPVTLAFSVTLDGQRAISELKLSRAAYKVGWADTGTVADAVGIRIDVHAVPVKD
ncbi:MAG: YceI family protein [Alphaproteobacteria bacterium]